MHTTFLCSLFKAIYFTRNSDDFRQLYVLFLQDWPKGRYIYARQCGENKQTAKQNSFLWKVFPCFPHKHSFFWLSLYLLSQVKRFYTGNAHCSSRFTSGSVKVNYCKLEKLFYKFSLSVTPAFKINTNFRKYEGRFLSKHWTQQLQIHF